MVEQRAFAAEWEELSRRLRALRFLARLPPDQRDDVIQDTGLRLFQHWSHVPSEYLWPYTVAIARNILRDSIRLSVRKKIYSEPHDAAEPDPGGDVEAEAIARVELVRVFGAAATLRPRDRQILLSELGVAPAPSVTPGAFRVALHRARTRLRTSLERLPGFTITGWERLRRILAREGFHPFAPAALHQLLSIALVIGATGLANGDGARTTDAAGRATHITYSPTSRTDPRAALSPRMEVVIPRQTTRVGDGLQQERHSSPPSARRLNENFGPIRSGQDGIYVGEGGNGWGPYGTRRSVSESVAGNNIAADVEATYTGPRCSGEITVPSNTYRCKPGRARARGRISVNDTAYEVQAPRSE